jgi:DNA-binding beta-propeller fold protein YncE
VKVVEVSSHRAGRRVRSVPARAALAGALVAVTTATLCPGCRKGESPGSSPASQVRVTGASPTPQEPAEPSAPQIRETAAADQPPYAGMKEPRDAAVDSRGRLWVADFGNSRLRVFDGKGGYLGGLGNRGNGTYELRDPCGVAIAGDDVYVADTWNGRVQSYSITGVWKATAAGLFGPRGVAASPDGKVWVTDTGNNQLFVYDRSLANPQKIGKAGSGHAEFEGPVGVAVAPSGEVFVADTRNRRVQVLGPDGEFRRALAVPGWEGSPEPHLEVGNGGEIYLTDPNAGRVLQLDGSGRLRHTWTADETGKPFARPMGLAIDRGQNVLYVIDVAGSTVARISLAPSKKP